jgi:hypothetical protein
MKKTFLAAMLAVGIGAAASPAFARGEGGTMMEPNPVPTWLHEGAAQAPQAQIASQRLAALAMRWITAQNDMAVAGLGEG